MLDKKIIRSSSFVKHSRERISALHGGDARVQWVISVPTGRSKVYFFIAIGIVTEKGRGRGPAHIVVQEGLLPFLGCRNLRSVELDKTTDRIFIICNLHGEVRLVKSGARMCSEFHARVHTHGAIGNEIYIILLTNISRTSLKIQHVLYNFLPILLIC